MIDCQDFYQYLQSLSVDFFTGVPDSLLKDICAYISENSQQHTITANEGAAVGLAAGYHLATNKIPLVYMQNSGLGNSINPFASLTHSKVYSIPLLMMIGWRGEPGVHDEPQHIKQGEVTPGLLELLDIPYKILEQQDWRQQVQEVYQETLNSQRPCALLIRKGLFSKYSLSETNDRVNVLLSREEAIQKMAAWVDKAKNKTIVSTTGMISRELYSFRNDHNTVGRDFYNVGSMGHASQIALGLAMALPEKSIFCFDGDGSVLMHMGSLAISGNSGCKNFFHIVFDNEAHDSVGGQATLSRRVPLTEVARCCGYETVFNFKTKSEFYQFLSETKVKNLFGPTMILIKVKKGHRRDLMRPKMTPLENKQMFRNNLL